MALAMTGGGCFPKLLRGAGFPCGSAHNLPHSYGFPFLRSSYRAGRLLLRSKPLNPSHISFRTTPRSLLIGRDPSTSLRYARDDVSGGQGGGSEQRNVRNHFQSLALGGIHFRRGRPNLAITFALLPDETNERTRRLKRIALLLAEKILRKQKIFRETHLKYLTALSKSFMS